MLSPPGAPAYITFRLVLELLEFWRCCRSSHTFLFVSLLAGTHLWARTFTHWSWKIVFRQFTRPKSWASLHLALLTLKSTTSSRWDSEIPHVGSPLSAMLRAKFFLRFSSHGLLYSNNLFGSSCNTESGKWWFELDPSQQVSGLLRSSRRNKARQWWVLLT